MRLIVGILILVLSVLGGYLPHGNFAVLFQPFEVLIIVGGAVGALVIATPWRKIKKATSRTWVALSGSGVKKEHYLQAITLMYQLSRRKQQDGIASLEKHLANPEDSNIFQSFPLIYKDKESMSLIAEGVSLLFFEVNEKHEIEDILDGRLHIAKRDDHYVTAAIAGVGQALPAFGIVAAIMGIIITMGHIDGTSDVIAQHMSAALVGTFIGILIAYGIVSPSAEAITHVSRDIQDFRNCIKFGVLAYVNPLYSPAAITEIMRHHIPEHYRPTIDETEDYYLKSGRK
jgi:chemotaxis protein MotA